MAAISTLRRLEGGRMLSVPCQPGIKYDSISKRKEGWGVSWVSAVPALQAQPPKFRSPEPT